MSTKPVLKAARNIVRATKEQLAAFEGVPVGNIVDAIGRTGAMAAHIKPVTKATDMIGSAITVDAGPRDNLAPWAALRLAEPGDVMVIATGGHLDASVCGDLVIGMAKNAGIRAVITDGAVRDRSGIDALGVPVFSAGISPNSPQKNGPGSVGLPIVVGGVSVSAGDIVCCDQDGVVVVPAGRTGEAIEGLKAVRAKEVDMEQAVKAGATAPKWLADQPLDDLFDWVDVD